MVSRPPPRGCIGAGCVLSARAGRGRPLEEGHCRCHARACLGRNIVGFVPEKPSEQIILTDEEIQELRARVRVAHVRKSYSAPARFVEYLDGPLAGIRHPVEAWTVTSAAIHAWCIVRHNGPCSAV